MMLLIWVLGLSLLIVSPVRAQVSVTNHASGEVDLSRLRGDVPTAESFFQSPGFWRDVGQLPSVNDTAASNLPGAPSYPSNVSSTNEFIVAIPDLNRNFDQLRWSVGVQIEFLRANFYQNQDVKLRVYIINQGDKSFRFALSSILSRSIFVELWDPSGNLAPLLPAFENEVRYGRRGGTDRYVILRPRESFATEIDLQEYFHIDQTGNYQVQALFFPGGDYSPLERLPHAVPRMGSNGGKYQVSSDQQYLSISAPRAVQTNLAKSQTQEAVSGADLPPYDVIAKMMRGRQLQQWNQVFEHIDLDKLVRAFPHYQGELEVAQSPDIRHQVLLDFQDYLRGHWSDPIDTFQVKETVVQGDAATVTTDVTHTIRYQTRVVRYVFELHRDTVGRWLVANYYTTVVS